MPFQLSNSAMNRLFPHGCGVKKLVLERTNVTAEYLQFRNDAPINSSDR